MAAIFLSLPGVPQGRELVTDTESGYFRIHVNCYSRVQTLTVLSEQVRKKDCIATGGTGLQKASPPSHPLFLLPLSLSVQAFEVTNYLCLYNVYEKYLNNLTCRYDDGLISDFFT